jgi:hypothetical protein
MGHESYRHGGQEDHPDRKARHGQPVVTEVPRRRIVGCVEQYGRDEQSQGQLGLKHEGRHPRHERQGHATHGQERRIRRADPPRGSGQEDSREQQEEDRFEGDQESSSLVRSEGFYSMASTCSTSRRSQQSQEPTFGPAVSISTAEVGSESKRPGSHRQ